MQIVILCGGLATRLGDLVKNIPKSMIEIDGKPFLEYQIENLKENSIRDIVLCVGHLSEKIESYFQDGSGFGVNIKYSHDGDKLLGPIGAVKNAENLLEDIFFITAGGDLKKELFSKCKDEKHPFPVYSNSLSNKGLYGYSSDYEYNANCVLFRSIVSNCLHVFMKHRMAIFNRISC